MATTERSSSTRKPGCQNFGSSKLKPTVASIAGFGAAMATVALPHSAEAQILPLSFAPSSVPFGTGAAVYFLLPAYGSIPFALAAQSNIVSKNIVFGSALFGSLEFGVFSYSNVISANTPAGAFASGIPFSASATGTPFIGFRGPSGDPFVGWFQIDLGGSGGAVQYLAGAFNIDPTSSIGIGKFTEPAPVPGPPAALGALAALAQGRRIRKRIKAAARKAESAAA